MLFKYLQILLLISVLKTLFCDAQIEFQKRPSWIHGRSVESNEYDDEIALLPNSSKIF